MEAVSVEMVSVQCTTGTRGPSASLPALEAALLAAEATAAHFDTSAEAPESVGWKRDQRKTGTLRRFFGLGSVLNVGQASCRINGRSFYSLGMPLAVLENVRAQVLIVPLVIFSVGYPVVAAQVVSSAARLTRSPAPRCSWSCRAQAHPIPYPARPT